MAYSSHEMAAEGSRSSLPTPKGPSRKVLESFSTREVIENVKLSEEVSLEAQ
jgi:hypothetical protein